MRLKLVIDKNRQKVLFAEVGKPFVDFLFHLLKLPIGVVIVELRKKGMMGCFGDLYESVESLSESYMQPHESKIDLLKPSFSWYPCFPLTPERFYVCSKMPYTPSSVRPKRRNTMASRVSCVSSMDDEKVEAMELYTEGGYVKGGLSYIVTDALAVKPLSAFAIAEVLRESNVNEVVGELEEKVVDFTVQEVCNPSN